MDKSAIFSETFKDARDLFKEGMYRKAISKFEMAFTVAPDEESMIDARFWIVNCHAWLKEVSGAELVGLGRRADDFCFFSIRRFCVAATSWSQWWYEYTAKSRLKWPSF